MCAHSFDPLKYSSINEMNSKFVTPKSNQITVTLVCIYLLNFKVNMSNCQRDIERIDYFHVYYDLLTFDITTSKSDQSTIMLVCMHAPNSKLTCQTIPDLSKKHAIFMHTMVCDLWPYDHKIVSDHCHSNMHTCSKSEIDTWYGS